MQAQTELEMLVQEAPLPVMPVAQVNVSLVNILEALLGIIENLWNPDAGQPPENLIHAIQESRQILQTSSVIISQEGGAALDVDFDARQDPDLWDLDEDEAEEVADFEEAHAPGGPLVEATVSRARQTATVNAPITREPKKTRTAAPVDAAQGGAQSSQAQRLSARAMMNPKDTELLALSQRACAIIPALASS